MRVGLPLSPQRLERLQVQVSPGGLSFLVDPLRFWFRRSRDTGPAKALTVARPEVDDAEPLHTNACGDFTLLARDDWFDLRGYPEFDLFSLHLDSVFCYAAHFAGIREVVLTDPIRMYHIEHEVGSGSTPEGITEMFSRLKAKGLPWLEHSQVMAWADQMRSLGATMIFNRGNWGLADSVLPETRLGRPQGL
jgi:hypothetical protein